MLALILLLVLMGLLSLSGSLVVEGQPQPKLYESAIAWQPVDGHLP